MALIDPTRPFNVAAYPLIPSRATYKSACVIDACWPVEWDPTWHRMIQPTKELQERVQKKFGNLLKKKGELMGGL